MESPIYIIGHKNPDPDSICAPIAYSSFKKAIGQDNCIPARCGNTNARIDAILNHFKLQSPVFLGDVTPRIEDIMVRTPNVHKVYKGATYAEALEIMDEYDVRSLPVLGEKDSIEGMIEIFSMGQYFIPNPNARQRMRVVKTNIAAIVKSLRAEAINLFEEEKVDSLYVRVGAMDTETFGDFTHKGDPELSIVVVGNRMDIQDKAIDLGVKLLVVTGKEPISEDIIKKSKDKQVSLIKSSFDVASTAWIIRSAEEIDDLVDYQGVVTFSPDEPIRRVKKKMVNKVAPIYFVGDEHNRLLGIFSKSDILKPVNTRLVLMDHNELSQAVTGADEVIIEEIIDHHKLGNPPTHRPIRFVNEPVGSTCTIVANMFRKENLTPEPEIAGVMMGGIITDTLNLNSPTTTDVDRELLPWLGTIAGIKPNDFAALIFNSGSIILNSMPGDVIQSDCKNYTENGFRYSVSQVEELGFDNFWNHADQLKNALDKYRQSETLDVSLLFVTDINTQNSLLIAQGSEEFVEQITYPQIENHNIFELKGIVSRKKQLIPYITSLLVEDK